MDKIGAWDTYSLLLQVPWPDLRSPSCVLDRMPLERKKQQVFSY